MDMGSIIGIVGIVITTIIAVYAIRDVRKEVRGLIHFERKRVYTRVRNDMVWLFVDPAPDAHSPEIAKGIEEFAVVSQAYDPSYTADLSKEAINNESLVFADKLVNAGYATWKQGWNMNEVRKTLHNWQTSINANRLRNILGKDEVEKELL
jgi:hypothetical protein